MNFGLNYGQKMLMAGALLYTLSGCQTVQEVKAKLPSLQGPTVDKVGDMPKVDTPKWDDASEALNDNRAIGYGLVSMPTMEAYLNGLYAKVKKTAEVPDWPGKIYIASDTTLNAHPDGAGNIYINIAVLQSFESEDEIFALLAHEFSHIYLGHQAAFSARTLTDSAAFVATAAVKVATKQAGVGGWGSQENIAMVGGAANNILLPAWQRSVEEQADRLGATISLRNGYSYASGFKAFLERVADVEKQTALHTQAQVAAKRAVLAQARTTDVDKAIGDVSDSLGDKISDAVKSATQNHDDAVSREDALSQQVMPLLPRPRPQPRVTPWRNALKEKATAEILAHYALLPRVEQLMASNKTRDALKLAMTAASGATASDGAALLRLYEVMQKTNTGSRTEQIKVLLRNQDSPQRSWAVQMVTANALAATDKVKAKEFLDQQYAYFGKASRTVPDVIGFYNVVLADNTTATMMALQCTVTNPRFREICADRAKTDAQRQAEKAQSEAKSKAIAEGIVDKLKFK